MTMDPVGSAASTLQATMIGSSADNEAAEIVPDNEAVESYAPAPLADYQGTRVDLMA